MAAGPADGRLVVLLHGFPEFWYGWRRQIGSLAAAGLRVVAPDLRGYNLSAKPDGLANYVLDVLADDVLGIASALGRRQFAVVGHDWGGVLAWHLASRDPDRVERAAILNAPHPATMGGFARASEPAGTGAGTSPSSSFPASPSACCARATSPGSPTASAAPAGRGPSIPSTSPATGRPGRSWGRCRRCWRSTAPSACSSHPPRPCGSRCRSA